jgi:5-methylcytosine-specific restriction endonuclease McrA
MSIRTVILTGIVALLVGIVAGVPIGDKSQWGVTVTPCAWCGVTNDIQVHHIYPQHLWPAWAHDTNNMVCLCPRCHLVLGHRGCWTNAVTNLLQMILEGKK